MQCVGGDARKFPEYHPKAVQCYNRGGNYNVNWECKANLDNKVQFGRLNVNCEGYDSPEDEYVLVDSCGVSYVLYEIVRTQCWNGVAQFKI